jgi:ankyrin repeat protein
MSATQGGDQKTDASLEQVMIPKLAEWLIEHGFSDRDASRSNASGVTPLIKAASQGNAAIVRELIAAGAALNTTSPDGNNAIWFGCASGSLETIELLVSAGVNIDYQNPDGATALIYAASSGKAAAVERLLRMGADPAPLTVDGFSALDLASTLECLQLLRATARCPASPLDLHTA